MKRMVVVINIIILSLVTSGCFRITLQLPTDNISSATDSHLIRNKISTKQQVYELDKSLYKTSSRKSILKKYEVLSKEALNRFINKVITRKIYDNYQKESKYIIQRAIYMMKDEESNPGDNDVIYKYLETGIANLNDILEGE